ncbi:helix-turn-helix domain-containing protein [Actinomyces bowdenii]|uniref:helix-turn-helix domain-containing protein n=1 Tax=Actinomyces bowdenii TaxID=131109 RepID=UPI00214AA127|nr:helix-turn-helix domain-containing protein [Actinomyces bowdenii]MCR2052007.1 helix-turn-helix domain-containing protein [Actinomyces bowdenii]
MTTTKHLITASEAARRLNVGVRTVIRWIEEGSVEAVGKIPGKNGPWLIEEQEVERVAAKRRAELLARMPLTTTAQAATALAASSKEVA